MNPSADRLAKGPVGLTAMGIFLLFGAFVAFLAGTTLVWPGTVLDLMWDLNPHAYQNAGIKLHTDVFETAISRRAFT